MEAFATAAHSAGHIPGCPKGSRPLTSSASTLTLISVVFARLRQLRGVSGTDWQHVQDGVVRFPLPCQGLQTLLGEWAQRLYRWLRTSRWRSLTNHRQGVYPHTPRLGLILCAPSEAVKFEISGADTVRSVASHSLLEHHHHRLQACHRVHAFPSDLAAFNGGMTKYASRSEDHWIDVFAAHEPELVLPRQVSRQATSRNPGGLQGSWFPASLTRKTYEDQDLGWHIATAALPCPCCPNGFL